MNHFQQVKSFILNHGSHVKWLSNVSLFIANAVDTSEMRFLKEKKTSIVFSTILASLRKGVRILEF